MRQIGKELLKNIFNYLLLFLFILLLPILLPTALVFAYIKRRRISRLAKSFICVSCGKQLGAEAIQLGNERWDSHVSEMHAKYPNRKFRRLRSIHAVCPHCGCEYRYIGGTNHTFELIPQKESVS